MTVVGYILKNKKTGQWIDLDSASGGYPYDVKHIWRAYRFSHKEEAEHYNATMSWDDYDNPLYTVHELRMEATLVDSRTGDQLRNLQN